MNEHEERKAEILKALETISDSDLVMEFEIESRRTKPLEKSLEITLMRIEILNRMNI